MILLGEQDLIHWKPLAGCPLAKVLLIISGIQDLLGMSPWKVAPKPSKSLGIGGSASGFKNSSCAKNLTDLTLRLPLLLWAKVHVQGRKPGPGRPPFLSPATLCFMQKVQGRQPWPTSFSVKSLWLRLLTDCILEIVGKVRHGVKYLIWVDLVWQPNPVC